MGSGRDQQISSYQHYKTSRFQPNKQGSENKKGLMRAKPAQAVPVGTYLICLPACVPVDLNHPETNAGV
jgi:hypothetical protein